jgi:hypothetical protein
MPMSLKITGFEELRGELGAMERAVSGDATLIAVRAAATPIRDEMATEAPVLDHKTAQSTALDPGALKSGISFSVRRLKDGLVMALIGPRKGTRRAAHLVEYGHLLVKGGKLHIGPKGPEGEGKIIGQVQQHPFLRPSFEVSWRPALTAFAAALKQQLGRWVK